MDLHGFGPRFDLWFGSRFPLRHSRWRTELAAGPSATSTRIRNMAEGLRAPNLREQPRRSLAGPTPLTEGLHRRLLRQRGWGPNLECQAAPSRSGPFGDGTTRD